MATPIDIKKREAAKKQQQKPPKSPRNSNNLAVVNMGREPTPNGGGSSTSGSIPTPTQNSRRQARSEGYVDDEDYANFSWDDWVGRPLPPTIHFVEVKISPDNLLAFHGRDHFLSTFYPCKFEIGGHPYYSVEGYYEAVKIFCNVGVDAAQSLSDVRSAAQVKSMARNILREHRIDRRQVDKWKETHGVRALYVAITKKFLQSEQLRKQLLATGEKLLVHSYPTDKVYASGCTEEALKKWAEKFAGKSIKIPLYENIEQIQKYLTPTGAGRNILGYVTMRVRAEIGAYENSADVFNSLTLG